MICKYCGRELPDNSVSCTGCGATLTMRDIYAQNNNAQSQPQPQNNYAQPQNNYAQPQNNYTQPQPQPQPQNGYAQQMPGGYMSQTFALLNNSLNDAKSALGFAIAGLVLFAGIGLIFTIIALVKSGKKPVVDAMSLNPQERMLYDQVMAKFKSAKTVAVIGLVLTILAVVGTVVAYILLGSAILAYSF